MRPAICAIPILLAVAWGEAAPGRIAQAADEGPSSGRLVRTGGGPALEARFTELTAAGWSGQTAAGPLHVNWDQLVCWGAPVRNRTSPEAVLHDGSVLVGEVRAVTDAEVRLRTRWFGEVVLPRRLVAGLILRVPLDPADQDQWQHWLRQRESEPELIRLTDGDEWTGTLSWPATDAGGASVQVRESPQAEPRELSPERLSLVAFKSPPRGDVPAAPRAILSWSDGSCLFVERSGTTTDSGAWRLAKGEQLSLSNPEVWKQLVGVQSLPRSRVYLSHLPPIGYRQIPFLSRDWKLGIDRSAAGGRLSAAGQLYLLGLGMHAAARATFPVPPGTEALEAEVALDDAGRGQGSVVFRVYVDRTPLADSPRWELGWESPLLRGSESPRPLRVSLDQATRVALVADYADGADVGDHADWLNARFVLAVKNSP